MQLKLNIYKGNRGGRRPGSGRKRMRSKGVAHRRRERISWRTPLHINFKFRTSIKNKQNLRLLKRAIMNARKLGLRGGRKKAGSRSSAAICTCSKASAT